MDRYRKKPVVIDAVQWDGTAQGAAPIIDRILRSGGRAVYLCADPERCAAHGGDAPHTIRISTLEGDMSASIGDWIIRGVHGEFYPCKPQVFAATYEPLHEPAETFTPPDAPTPPSQGAIMSTSTARDDYPAPAEQPPADARVMNAFTRALQLANTQGSATVGYRDSDADSDFETGYDVTVVRISGGTATDPEAPTPPTKGLDVLYTLNEADAAAINKRRADYAAFQKTVDGQPEPGARGATGHVAHVGNHVRAGDVYPAQVVNTFGGGPAANLQVTLDGTDTYWATSRTEGDGPGYWAVLQTAQ